MNKIIEQDEFDRSSYTTAGSVAAAPGSSTVIDQALTEKRQAMLDLVAKWMPTSLNQPMIPPGETQDLLGKAGWDKAKGEASKKVSDDNKKNGTHNPVATSCGDVLATLLRLWNAGWVGAFMIRDKDTHNKPPGAKDQGWYVEADGVKAPKRGDILVLRNGVGKSSTGSVGHVGILIGGNASIWRTADGGGGQLPDQTASVTDRAVKLGDKNIPILISPTDRREKQLDGWVDLDKMPRSA